MYKPLTETSINKMKSNGSKFKIKHQIYFKSLRQYEGKVAGNAQLTFPLRIQQNKKLDVPSSSMSLHRFHASSMVEHCVRPSYLKIDGLVL